MIWFNKGLPIIHGCIRGFTPMRTDPLITMVWCVMGFPQYLNVGMVIDGLNHADYTYKRLIMIYPIATNIMLITGLPRTPE